MLETFIHIVDVVNDFIWGPVALVFLGFVGIYLTVGTKFVHIRKFFSIIKDTFSSIKNDKNDDTDGDVSSLLLMFVSIASVVGMGMVVGGVSPLICGWYGAHVWRWIAALIGMIIKYSEIILIILFREKTNVGTYVGGPALYVRKGLGARYL